MHFLAFPASLRLPPLPSSPRDPQPLLGICVIRLIFCTHLHTGQLRMMLLADFLERIRSCQPKKEFISKKENKEKANLTCFILEIVPSSKTSATFKFGLI